MLLPQCFRSLKYGPRLVLLSVHQINVNVGHEEGGMVLIGWKKSIKMHTGGSDGAQNSLFLLFCRIGPFVMDMRIRYMVWWFAIIDCLTVSVHLHYIRKAGLGLILQTILCTTYILSEPLWSSLESLSDCAPFVPEPPSFYWIFVAVTCWDEARCCPKHENCFWQDLFNDDWSVFAYVYNLVGPLLAGC